MPEMQKLWWKGGTEFVSQSKDIQKYYTLKSQV